MANYVLNFTSGSSAPIIGKSSIVIQPMKTDGPASPTDNNALNGGTYSAAYASTSMLLYGRGVPDYGARIQENLIQILEHHAGIVSPAHPTVGQLWYYCDNTNLSSGTLKLCSDVVVDVNNKSIGGTWVDLLTGTNTAAGFQLSSPLMVSGLPININDVTSKEYVDNVVANIPYTPSGGISSNTVRGAIAELDAEKLSLSGGAMTGILQLAVDPVNVLDATTKQYTDTKVSLSGGNMSGALYLAGDPTANLGAATKQYADTKVSLSGGVMTGILQLVSDPVNALDAATKQYADTKVSLSGGIMTGILRLVSDPVNILDAATKQYTDTKVSFSGGVMTGILQLVSDPINTLDAATKQYVDNAVVNSSASVVISGSLDVTTNDLHLVKSQSQPDVVISNIAAAGHTHQAPGIYVDLTRYPSEPLNTAFASNAAYPVIPLDQIINSLDTSKAATTYVDTKTTIARSIVTSTGTANYTTPSYVVGSNRLWVFVNGVKYYEGSSDEYTEDGVTGATSTSITFIANIPPSGASNRIEFLVVGS
jgi:hypothetical protein